MANCNDVARLANVSRQTVSRVINNSGSVSEDARQRVLDAIAQLGYYPNTAARSLKSTKSKTIGFIVPDASNDFYIRIANILQKKLSELNYSLLILFSDEDEQTEERCLSTLIENRIELLLFTPTGINQHFLSLLAAYDIKAIQLFRYLYSNLASISIDDAFGSYLATSSLLKKGHRRLLLIEEAYSFESVRLLGFQQALSECNISFESPMYLCQDRNSDEIGAIKEALTSYAPTAVIAVAKSAEIALMKATFELQLSIHQDIEVIFYDDNEIAEFFGISTIAHDLEQVTDTIIETVIASLGGQTDTPHIALKPFLLQRNL